MAEYYAEICKYLKSEHFHYMNRWVKECVDYYVSSNPNINLNQLKNDVRQQWLYLNLRDIKIPALPAGLKEQTKMILPGNYVVQVETMWDCGESMYSQWQKINKTSLENLNATKIPVDECAPRRCLRMTVTDGVQELCAMEYGVIPALSLNNSDLPPGFKILLLGPIICRKGMLLLNADNVKVLGGEVDVFSQSHSLPVVIANFLNIDAEPAAIVQNQLVGVDETWDPNDLLDDNDDFLMNVDDDERHNDAYMATVPPMSVPDSRDNFETQTESLRKHSSSVQTTMVRVVEDFPDIQETIKSTSERSVSYKTSNLLIPVEPFVYLAQMIPLSLNNDVEVKVKIVILTLKTKIIVINDEFSLQATICDGSSSLDVIISTQILEDLLGFSPCEQAVLLKERSKNSAIAERLRNAFVSTQKRLITLNSIATVRFYREKLMPKVVSIQDLEKNHLAALAHRKC